MSVLKIKIHNVSNMFCEKAQGKCLPNVRKGTSFPSAGSEVKQCKTWGRFQDYIVVKHASGNAERVFARISSQKK